MRRAIIGLFIVLSLALAPMVHAAEVNCAKIDCVFADCKAGKQKPDGGKIAKVAAHDCFAHHIANPSPLRATGYTANNSSLIVLGQPDDLPSIVVGPLLEPPANA